MIDEIRDLYAYTHWANQRVLEACTALSPDDFDRDMRSSFPSVLATLRHTAQADWVWLERWHGRSPAMSAWGADNATELQQRWTEVMQAQQAFLRGLTDADLHSIVAYRNLKGESFEAPLWQLLRHVVNHSTYHRGQVITMLRQLGAPAPATDLVLYYRLQAAGLLTPQISA